MSMIVNELFWVKKGIHLLSKSYVKSWIATDETLILLRFKNMIVIYFSIHKACTSVCPLSFGRIDWFSFDKYTVHILTSFVLFVKYIERILNKWSIFYLFYLRFSVTLNLPLSNLWILQKKLVETCVIQGLQNCLQHQTGHVQRTMCGSKCIYAPTFKVMNRALEIC